MGQVRGHVQPEKSLPRSAHPLLRSVTSPRERGKYAGHFGAVTAIGTIGGPLLGGVITGTLNWRWNFYIAIPFAVAAIFLIQRRLQLPPLQVTSRKIDYFGIVLISSGAALLLLAFVLWESKAANPLFPLSLFKNRSFSLAVVASLPVGIAMFSTSAYLSQYMQLARGATPTESGLMTSPMMVTFLLASTIAVSAMGALLTNSVATALAAGIPKLPEKLQAEAAQLLSSGQVPAIQSLPEELKILVESAYGSGIGEAFYLGIPLAVIGLIAVFFIPNIPLNNMSAAEQSSAQMAKAAHTVKAAAQEAR